MDDDVTTSTPPEPASWDAVWTEANAATMCAGASAPYGAIEDAAIGVAGGVIRWVGPRRALPARLPGSVEVHGLGGAWVTPGLVDCHTHIVHAGDRAREFEMRLEGASYEDIARAGGGIVSTVRATREASEDALVDSARARIEPLLAEGVTTIEIKSGYGLDRDTELRMLRAARRLGQDARYDVCTTYLGAHALPPEYAGRADDYIEMVIEESLPGASAEGLADAVDAFCERIAFSAAQIERVFERARELGLPVKLHAGQLSDQGGAALAARFGALSADHLEYVGDEGVAAMARAGTVAVLLPGAFYFLGETRVPPIDRFRAHGVAMAIASDANPGSSPVGSLLLVLNMACTLFRLTPEEALAGATRNAARALGIGDRIGTIEAGKQADLAIFDVAHPAELAYRIGANPCCASIKRGVAVARPPWRVAGRA